MLTPTQIAQSCGCTLPRAENWAAVLNDAMGIFAIDTPARQAAFLAQVGHESGRLVYVRELWGPTETQKSYERDFSLPWAARLPNGERFRNSKPFELGNIQRGDGFRCRGAGLIQTTGRGNMAATRDGLRNFVPGVPDFEASPELLEAPKWAALSAAWFWHSRGLNALADAGNYMLITRKINGGTNGYADRLALWDDAKVALA